MFDWFKKGTSKFFIGNSRGFEELGVDSFWNEWNKITGWTDISLK